MTCIEDETTFIISSGALGQTTVLIVHDMTQINVTYSFYENKARYEVWAK
jgi:hypothetical protein